MFELADDWVWDSWLADDGETFHLFFLTAPKSLGDPALRHSHARVGHATSSDLTNWTRAADAVGGSQPGYDDRAVWTGCVVRDAEAWRMFRTGISLDEAGPVQRIGVDTSEDLFFWTPESGPNWPLTADPVWYEKSDTNEHWRDPWVVQDAGGLWHMYITARLAPTYLPEVPGRGVVGHAVSVDLRRWQVTAPLSAPGRMEQLEVMQVVEMDGRWVMVFSCLGTEMVGAEGGAGSDGAGSDGAGSGGAGSGGVWSVPIDGPGAPVDLDRAVRITDECVYVGRVIQDRAGQWQFLAFVQRDPAGGFAGGIIDPVPIGWNDSASALELASSPVPWCEGLPRQGPAAPLA